MSHLNVVEFPYSSLADIPAKLRAIADKIESGEYADVTQAVVVLNGDLKVFGLGADCLASAAYTYLGLAQRQLEKSFES